MAETPHSQPVGVANKGPIPIEIETLANVIRSGYKNCTSGLDEMFTWQLPFEWPDGGRKKASKLFRNRSSYARLTASLGGFIAAGKERIVEITWKIC